MNGARPVIATPWQSLHAGMARAGIAAPHQCFARRKHRCRLGRRGRRRIGQLERGEVVGDLAQVGVVEQRQQSAHQLVVATLVAKVAQLIEQIAGRLAGDARVVAVARGSAFATVAARAGEHALGDRVLERRALRRSADQSHGEGDERGRSRAGSFGERALASPSAVASRDPAALAQVAPPGACTSRASAASPCSLVKPATTPARSAAGRFWLTFHLPVSDVSVISMPTIARSIVST